MKSGSSTCELYYRSQFRQAWFSKMYSVSSSNCSLLGNYFCVSFLSFISKNFFRGLTILMWLSKEDKEFFHIELDRQGLSASLEAKFRGRLGLTQPRRGDQRAWMGSVGTPRLGTCSTVGVAPTGLKPLAPTGAPLYTRGDNHRMTMIFNLLKQTAHGQAFPSQKSFSGLCTHSDDPEGQCGRAERVWTFKGARPRIELWLCCVSNFSLPSFHPSSLFHSFPFSLSPPSPHSINSFTKYLLSFYAGLHQVLGIQW